MHVVRRQVLETADVIHGDDILQAGNTSSFPANRIALGAVVKLPAAVGDVVRGLKSP
jgi:hypothetical protein